LDKGFNRRSPAAGGFEVRITSLTSSSNGKSPVAPVTGSKPVFESSQKREAPCLAAPRHGRREAVPRPDDAPGGRVLRQRDRFIGRGLLLNIDLVMSFAGC